MKKAKNKGMTLIEIIVSIALLGIICVSLLPIFSGSMAIIFNHGRKSNALMEASSIVDEIYTNIDETYQNSTGPNYTDVDQVESMISTVLQNNYDGKYEYASSYLNITVPDDPNNVKPIRIYVGTALHIDKNDVNSPMYFPVSILVFHSSNKQHVIVSAAVPEGGN